MRKTLGDRLAYEGYTIESTDDVSEASKMCSRMAFDLVLTDDSRTASPPVYPAAPSIPIFIIVLFGSYGSYGNYGSYERLWEL